MPTSGCLLVIGAGGHAKVVLDAVRLCAASSEVDVRDDEASRVGTVVAGYAVQAPVGDPAGWPEQVHVAIGDNRARCRFGERAVSAGKRLYSVVHPRATVSGFAEMEGGVFVAAHAVVAPSAQLRAGVIVNHAAVVDHDCRIGAWTHVAPGAVLGGNVHVGERCLIGSGAIVLPGVRIGDDAVIGSGAVVTRDVPTGCTVVGIPARTRQTV